LVFQLRLEFIAGPQGPDLIRQRRESCLVYSLTPECAAAVSAVLEALGKKRGPENTRTADQQFRDALQEGCASLWASRSR